MGIKIKIPYSKETVNAIKIQNRYELNQYRQTDKLVVFIEVELARTSGGVM